MVDVNEITLTGRIAGSPVMRIDCDGEARLMLRVGVRSEYALNGAMHVHPNWFLIFVRGQRAEVLLRQVREGFYVRVEGALQSSLRHDKNGNRRSLVSIAATRVDVIEPENKS